MMLLLLTVSDIIVFVTFNIELPWCRLWAENRESGENPERAGHCK